ncbi:MAG TPA: AAA family ATPase, partial [Steroidobacteraceae bacterium]|nr:AAA family ATPase [Steroidobacteraceae bacterium]
MKPRALPKFLSPRTHRVVRRARVLAAIARALEGGVCWISAPAGFGKTTAVVDYLHAEGARHLWYRVDAGDGDIASFFHYLRLALRGPRATRTLPAFGPEFSDQPAEFARRFFRGYLARVEPGTILVFDDLHEADTAAFNQVLAILLRELPDSLRCVCLSRALPPREIAVDASRARLSVIDHNLLTFSRPEARALLGKRAGPTFETDDFASAHGWAAGLVLLAERKAAGTLSAELERHGATNTRTAIFGALASQLFESLTASEQDALLRLSVLPEITPDLARALTSASVGEPILEQLHRRQLLVNRRGDGHAYELHDLLREFLGDRLAITFSQQQLDELQLRAAAALHAAGRGIDAVDLAIRARAWERASAWLLELAPRLVAQGRRITLIDWCTRLPDTSLSDPWLCYWLGVANMADDAIATKWLDRAWTLFSARREAAAQCLTAARAVLAKTDSWRTHEGLATWTQRAL